MTEHVEYAGPADFLAVLWRQKWWVLCATSVCAVLAFGLSYLIEPRYRSTVSLVAVEGQEYGSLSGLLSRASGLASMIGLQSGGTSAAESLEFLKSHYLREQFILQNELIPLLYPERIDDETGQWTVGAGQPSLYRAVQKFGKEVLSVDRDTKTGLMEVSVVWGDPALARTWANSYVRLADTMLRARAREEAVASLEYLMREFEETTIVTIRQAIAAAIEQHVGKIAMLEANSDYAYRVIDPAMEMDLDAYVWPRHALIGFAGLTLGLVASGVMVILVAFAGGGVTRREASTV